MFTAPTAIRVLKKHDPAYLQTYDLAALKHLFLAGEPLDEPTPRWSADALGVDIIDNYWQTETGWPILPAQPGIEETPRKFGSPSFRSTATTSGCCATAAATRQARTKRQSSRSCRRCRPVA